jgi:F0F1-type ATP synthase assembly protein I
LGSEKESTKVLQVRVALKLVAATLIGWVIGGMTAIVWATRSTMNRMFR